MQYAIKIFFLGRPWSGWWAVEDPKDRIFSKLFIFFRLPFPTGLVDTRFYGLKLKGSSWRSIWAINQPCATNGELTRSHRLTRHHLGSPMVDDQTWSNSGKWPIILLVSLSPFQNTLNYRDRCSSFRTIRLWNFSIENPIVRIAGHTRRRITREPHLRSLWF